MDPRLFLFIHYIKEKLPNAYVKIVTNAYYLNEVMVEELQECGVDILWVSAYGKSEYDRLMRLEVDIAYAVFPENFDERMDFYTEREKGVLNQRCATYISQVVIFPNGSIGTCCLDYKCMYDLGNIVENTLESCLNSNIIIEFQKELLNGNRNRFTVCKNCQWSRWL